MVKAISDKYINYLRRQLGENTGYVFSEDYQEQTLRPFFDKYASTEVIECFNISIKIYFDSKNPTESLSEVLDKVGGILYNRKNNLTVVKWDGK